MSRAEQGALSHPTGICQVSTVFPRQFCFFIYQDIFLLVFGWFYFQKEKFEGVWRRDLSLERYLLPSVVQFVKRTNSQCLKNIKYNFVSYCCC